MDTDVDAMGVLSNLELLERAGVDTDPYLRSIGLTRTDLTPGRPLAWDTYAVFLEGALASIDPTRLATASDEMTRQFAAFRTETDLRSTRAALTYLVSVLARTLWPVFRWEIRDRGLGFCEIEIELPEPRVVPTGYHVMNGPAMAGFPVGVGQSAARLLNVSHTPDERRATYFFELVDEHVADEPGPLGTQVRGIALVGLFDILDLAGFGLAPWFRAQGLDRAQLLSDALVEWALVRDALAAAAAAVGEARLRESALQFAELTSQIRTHIAGVHDAFSLFEYLHQPALTSDCWGPLQPPRALAVMPATAVVRVQMRRGMDGNAAFLGLQAGALEGMTSHLGLPRAPTRVFVDPDGRGATYVIDLPEPIRHSPTVLAVSPMLTGDESLARVTKSLVSERGAARAAVIERLGRALAEQDDVHGIASLVIGDLVEGLHADGAELVTVSDGREVPVCARGARDGLAISRSLVLRGEAVGAIRIWTGPQHSGNTLAALDVVTPWIAVALGTAVHRARQREALAESERSRMSLEQALHAVLAVHPSPVFVVDAAGESAPVNTAATKALEEDAPGALVRIARAIGDPDTRALVVRLVSNGLERFVVVDGPRPPEERLARLTSTWKLTPRQAEVVSHVLRGRSNKEIASELGCAEVTIENHLTAAFRRVGVDSRAQLLARALAT